MNFQQKNKEKLSSNMNIYSGDIHSVTSPQLNFAMSS